MILGGKQPGKVGRRRNSSLAQSVEHAAVNRVVVGSSPTGGAKNRHSSTEECRFYLLPIHSSLFPKKTCRFLESNK